jgi:nucleoside-diphosphate-sugar epimerase
VETLTGGLSAAPQHAVRIQAADIILHMAGLSHADTASEYQATNYEGTQSLLSVCRKDQTFVYLSTRCVGEQGGAYGSSKLLAEKEIQTSGCPFIIIRPAEVYGSKAGEGIDALLDLARRFRIFIDFRWSPEVMYSPVSVEELASFIESTVRTPSLENSVYTLCNDDSYTTQEILKALSKGLGKPIFRLPIPVRLLQFLQQLHVPLPFKPDQLARLVMAKSSDNTMAKQDYGFSPVSLLTYLESGPSRQ